MHPLTLATREPPHRPHESSLQECSNPAQLFHRQRFTKCVIPSSVEIIQHSQQRAFSYMHDRLTSTHLIPLLLSAEFHTRLKNTNNCARRDINFSDMVCYLQLLCFMAYLI